MFNIMKSAYVNIKVDSLSNNTDGRQSVSCLNNIFKLEDCVGGWDILLRLGVFLNIHSDIHSDDNSSVLVIVTRIFLLQRVGLKTALSINKKYDNHIYHTHVHTHTCA